MAGAGFQFGGQFTSIMSENELLSIYDLFDQDKNNALDSREFTLFITTLLRLRDDGANPARHVARSFAAVIAFQIPMKEPSRVISFLSFKKAAITPGPFQDLLVAAAAAARANGHPSLLPALRVSLGFPAEPAVRERTGLRVTGEDAPPPPAPGMLRTPSDQRAQECMEAAVAQNPYLGGSAVYHHDDGPGGGDAVLVLAPDRPFQIGDNLFCRIDHMSCLQGRIVAIYDLTGELEFTCDKNTTAAKLVSIPPGSAITKGSHVLYDNKFNAQVIEVHDDSFSITVTHRAHRECFSYSRPHWHS